MRDIFLFILIFGWLPFVLKRTWVGIMLWSFISYANPHRQTWGVAYSFPFAQLTAITLAISLIFNREKLRFSSHPLMMVWLIFLVFMGLTTALAVFPDRASIGLTQIYKIQLITLLTVALITNRERVEWLIITICGSIGFYSIKGGIFTITTGGSFRVWGPAGSFIEDNNELGCAILMVVPLFFYLARICRTPRTRLLIQAGAALSMVAAVGTQSRGGFLALLAVAAYLVLVGKRKMLTLIGLLVFLPVLFVSMPESWSERMESIVNYQEDASAMGRINSWQYAINIANARPTGGGLNSWSKETFASYAPHPEYVFVAHSIWFSALADHGWPGLGLFVLIYAMTWRELGRLIKRFRMDPDNVWISDLSRMLKVSLIAYFVGGTFLSLTYFDLPWHFVAITLILHRIGRDIDSGRSGPQHGVFKVASEQTRGPTLHGVQ